MGLLPAHGAIVIEIWRRGRFFRLRIGAGPVSEKGGGRALGADGLALLLQATDAARAETLVVVEARGIASTAGTLIDSKSHLTLRPGEHVRLIGENGNQYCVDGPYDGPAKPERASLGEQTRSRWNVWKTGVRDRADPQTGCIE